LEGASSTRLIPVTAPFHTTQLQVIEPSISKALDRMRVVAPRWPILSSITQEFLVTEDDVRAEICRNVSRPMNWFATLKAGLGRGEAGWVESGASFILTDLVRDLFPDAGQYRDFRDMQGHHD
jgi:[acyl-carrier-protein] S-malonyltransferase